MTVPIIKSFVSQYPNVKITFVSKPFFKPLFQEIPNVTFFAVDTTKRYKGFWGLIQLFKDLKSLDPTHFADLHNVLRSKIIRYLFFLFTKVNIAKIDKGRKEKRALTRTKNKIFKPLKSSHLRYADVIETLGFKIYLNKKHDTRLNNPLSFINNKLFGIKDKHWIGIAPFAAFASKTYPEKLMNRVIEGLVHENIHLFLFGGKTDIEKLQSIEKRFPKVTCVAGKFDNLSQELNLIGNLDLMLSMDSGNAHFSAMLGIDTITIWGNTHPYAGFTPFNQPLDNCILPNLEEFPLLPCSIYGNKTFPGYENVMYSIAPEKIVKKIKQVLFKS